ncbi:MAG: protein translocase subunit SecF [Clostridia bacterium]|nr:protein translocase subunit SecF [Clostridia bacterium]
MLKNFHFVNQRKITLIIVGVVFLIGILSFIIRGFNVDIDFSGGFEATVDIGETTTDAIAENIRSLISNDSELGAKYVENITHSETLVKISSRSELTAEQQKHLVTLISTNYPDASKEIDISNISPVIGTKMIWSALLAVGIAVVLMLVYIAIRFEIASGVAAVICLVHDLFVMLTVYSLFQIPISLSIIAAFLTILGYSINATIVIFDRIRENRRKMERVPFGDVVNTSVHETVGRSINTTVTTLLTIGSIFIASFIVVIAVPTSNLDGLRNFSGTLIIGILAGLFSSMFLSDMLWNAINGGKVKEKGGSKSKKAKAKAAK